MLSIAVPKPSRFVKHSVVEEIASECNRYYRKSHSHNSGYPVNIEEFADLDLEITVVRDHIDEPELTSVFARLTLDRKSQDRCIVTVNSHYDELFDARPDLLRSTIGHEIGHCVLRHHLWRVNTDDQRSLFSSIEPKDRFFHDSSWKPLAFTKENMNEWCRRAFKGDAEARKRLEQLKDRMEPEWMFWQAEHFSMCLLIPRDKLFSHLDSDCDVGSWYGISRLAETFGVSPSMMRVRLSKIGAVTIENGNPVIGPLLKQPGLLK